MAEPTYSCILDPSHCRSAISAENVDHEHYLNYKCVVDSDSIRKTRSLGCNNGSSLSRCSSSSSLVTYVQSRKTVQHCLDEQGASSDTPAETTDSLGTPWTDDKHSSYLTFMEATFVKNMYEREYCAVELCGQTSHHGDFEDPNCAESQLRLPIRSTENEARFLHHIPPDADEGQNMELQGNEGVSSQQSPKEAADDNHGRERWKERLHSHQYTPNINPGVKTKNCSTFSVKINGDPEACASKHKLQQYGFNRISRKRGPQTAFEERPCGEHKASK